MEKYVLQMKVHLVRSNGEFGITSRVYTEWSGCLIYFIHEIESVGYHMHRMIGIMFGCVSVSFIIYSS